MVTLKMTTLEEVELGLEKDNTQVMRGGVVGQDQTQEQALIEIKLEGSEYNDVKT